MSNRFLYTLIAIGILAIVGVGVYAYNSGGPPSYFGHSIEEIAGPSGCVAGQYLQMTVTGWTCANVTVTGGESGLKPFVGFTSASYTGSQVGGYSGGDAKCAAQFGTGARMSYAGDFVYGIPTGLTTAVWYNTFAAFKSVNPIGEPEILQFNCYGWTSADPNRSGPAWFAGIPNYNSCNLAIPIACSK